MITVIYDINGTPHKVLAAGTVYSEEKNSLALGKETSAIGQDQLVFGRYNQKDSNKSEIVGGGTLLAADKVHLGDDINEYIEYIGSRIQILTNDNIYYGGRTPYDVKVALARILGVSSYNITSSDSLLEYDFFIITEKFINRENKYEYCIYARNKSTGDWYDGGTTIAINGYSRITPGTAVESVDIPNLSANKNNTDKSDADIIYSAFITSGIKNIRTLDWAGNQWNAGDITCDDGNGNTISLRALALAVAQLTT